MQDSIHAVKSYFASANTTDGFVSFFPEIFSGCRKLYIIKGGPGTGKSRLLRDISNEARNRDYQVEHFLCSSDPNSLDGILITDLGIGIVDGTAPHTLDPVYPGAFDEIINLGDFWKPDRLLAKKEKIEAITDRKKELFVTVYHFLSAYGMIDSERRKLIEQVIQYEKMRAAIFRLMRKVKHGSGFRLDIRLNEAITMDGVVYYPTYETAAETRYYLRDRYGIGYLLLHEIIRCAEEKKQPVTVSYSPYNIQCENAVFLPESGISYTILHEGEEITPEDHVINTERFIDTDGVRQMKAKLRFAARCCSSLLDGAVETLSEIKKLHFELEDIYSSAMDFRKKEEYTKRWLIKLFGKSSGK